MEFSSLTDLIRYVESAFSQKFYSGAALLRKSVLKVLASIWGGALYLLVLLAKKIWKNSFLTTCDVSCLDGKGAEFGLPHKAPTYARGYVTVTLSDGVSSATIPEDTYFVDSVTAKEFRTISATTVNSSSLDVLVIASEAGADSNMDSGVELSFRDSTPTGLEDTVEVASDGIAGGYSVEVEIDGETQLWGESAEEYRARLIYRRQNPVQGGSDADYKVWAESFPFVSNAFVYECQPHEGAVTVALANFHVDPYSISEDDLAQVEAYLTAEARRPITADVRVFSVEMVTFTFSGSVAPYNDSVRSSVQKALQSFLKELKPGEEKTFLDARSYVLSHSTANTFTISSVSKGGLVVSTIATDFDAENEIAEVGKAAVSLSNGEA